MVIQSLGRGSNGYKEAIGELGTGLGALAGTLIGAKLGSVARKHQEDAQTEAYIANGIPADQARKLARADTFTQQSTYQEHLNRGGLGMAPQQQDQYTLQQAPQMQQSGLSQLGALKAMNMPQFQGSQPSPYQNVMSSIGAPGQGPQAAQQGLNNLNTAGVLNLLAQPKEKQPLSDEGLKALIKSNQAQNLPQQQVAQPQQPVNQISPISTAPIPSQESRITPERQALMNDAFSGGKNSAKSWAALMAQPKQLTPAQKLEQEKENRISRKEEEAQSKQYYDSLVEHHRASRDVKFRLNKMEDKLENGKLPSAEDYRFYKSLEEDFPSASTIASAAAGAGAVGAAIGAPLGLVGAAVGGGIGSVGGGLAAIFAKPLASTQKAQLARKFPDLEEYEKLSAEFVKTAKQYFGSRLTDADLAAYMKTIPTLMNTKEGNLAIIKNMREMMDLEEAEYKIANMIIKDNGGRRPGDLAFRVQEQLDPYLDQIAENVQNQIRMAQI